MNYLLLGRYIKATSNSSITTTTTTTTDLIINPFISIFLNFSTIRFN